MYKKLFITSLLVAFAAYYLQNSILHLFNKAEPTNVIFTIDDLKKYNGIERPELYLSVLGKVFDVSKGAKHYGPGSTYHFFTGKDSSRSFVTGDFTTPDDKVSDLNPEELRQLNHWVQFYNKQYNKVGKLIGRYYDNNGKLTRYGKEVKKLLKAAQNLKDKEDLKKIKYPPCNVEWDAERGTRVWCTNRSGGILRDWVGVPRQMYEPGSEDYRCVCVKPSESNKHLKEYENCDEKNSCYVKT